MARRRRHAFLSRICRYAEVKGMPMKILVDISRLPEAPYSKPKLPAARKPERPYETMVSQAHKKKRDWSKVRRGSRPNWFYTPEQDKVIKEMRAQGKTYAEIGKELGRSPSAIRHRAKKLIG